MVTDLLHHLGRQLVRERFDPYLSGYSSDRGSTLDALMMATGESLRSTVTSIVSDTMSIIADSPSKLSYAKLVMYGLSPARMRRAGVVAACPYADSDARGSKQWEYGMSDPLQLAAFFAAFGKRQDAEDMLNDRKLYINAHDRLRATKNTNGRIKLEDGTEVDFGKWVPARDFQKTWVPPDFQELGLPLVEFDPTLDTLFMEGAFQHDDNYLGKIKRTISPTNADMLARISGLKHKRLHPLLQEIAYKSAYDLATKEGGARRYDDIIAYVRLCDPGSAIKIFRDTQGARQLLAITRRDTPSKYYVAGLRQLAQVADSTRTEVLPFMGRGPTADEVKAVNSIGIIHILHEMPWDLLEPLVSETGFRALALPYAEKLGPKVLREFLTDHPGRAKRVPDIDAEASVAACELMVSQNTSIADWDLVMTRMYECWTSSLQTRQAIHTATGDPMVSFLALLEPHGASSPDIRAMLKTHPRWREIRRALEGYSPPGTSSPWR